MIGHEIDEYLQNLFWSKLVLLKSNAVPETEEVHAMTEEALNNALLEGQQLGHDAIMTTLVGSHRAASRVAFRTACERSTLELCLPMNRDFGIQVPKSNHRLSVRQQMGLSDPPKQHLSEVIPSSSHEFGLRFSQTSFLFFDRVLQQVNMQHRFSVVARSSRSALFSTPCTSKWQQSRCNAISYI